MLAASNYALTICLLLAADPAATPQTAASDKQALAAVQSYVGQWRGVGQPKRGSSQGAWTEEAQWSWHFHQGRAELVAQLDGDKFFRALHLRPAATSGEFQLTAIPADLQADPAEAPQFRGKLADGVLVLAATAPQADLPARISIRLVAGGDRMLVLYEKQLGTGAYARLAEVGSTRQGSDFAKSAASGPECIVTGGLGTIAVMFEGKKYYVCCTGCREYFDEDPARAVAEYRERKAAEKAPK